MDLGLTDKVAIVTGSSRGLGLASATALVAEGCRVAICARGEARLSEAASELRALAGGDDRVLAVAADLSTETGVAEVIARTVDTFGGVDILVNNVGLARGGTVTDTTDADWHEAFDHTLFPAIRASRLAVPAMRRRGGGAIVIIASIYGRESGGRMTYNAVKAAEISLAKSMAQQLARDNIRVNSVAPGSISFPGGTLAPAAAGGSRRHGGIRPARAAVRPIRHGRGSRSGRRVSRVSPRQLDQRRAASPWTAASRAR